MTVKINFGKFRKVTCADGFHFVAIASKMMHGVTTGKSLEIITPSEPDSLIAEYAEYDCPEMMRTHGNYSFVPAEVVEALIDKHKGIHWITDGLDYGDDKTSLPLCVGACHLGTKEG